MIEQSRTPVDAADRPSLVLSGGGALGAYEVGVVQYVAQHILPELPPLGLGYICGTSIGAINAGFVAGFSHDLQRGVRAMAEVWKTLALQKVIPIRSGNLLSMLYKPAWAHRNRRDGVADPSHFIHIIVHDIPWLQKRRNLARGHYAGFAVATTRIKDGKSEIFYENHDNAELYFANDRYTMGTRTQIGPSHVMASSAFPFLFPPARVREEYYTDGGIRYNTPLSPALRLGARRMLVVTLTSRGLSHQMIQGRVEEYNSPLYLGGKMLQALLTDQAENELMGAEMFNRLLAAGREQYGEAFVQQFQEVTRAVRGSPIHPARICHLAPSQNVHHMARDAARKLMRKGSVGYLNRRLLGWLSDSEESELLSVMLIDGSFTGELIALGYADAKKNHDKIMQCWA